jgi:hypothetical protein
MSSRLKVSADSRTDLCQAGEASTIRAEVGVKEDPEMVELMIHYFYHLDYSLEVGGSGQAATRLSQPDTLMIDHIAVFDLAVKYQIEGLRNLAAQKFKLSAETNWDHKDFVDAVAAVHESTAVPRNNSQLRDIVLDIFYEHIDALMEKEEIDALLRVNSRLAYDLLTRDRDRLAHR